MSGHNADHTIPPGDRDDAPLALGGPDNATPAGREPAQKAVPDIDNDIARLENAIGEAQLALAELKMARTQDNLPTAKSAAWRLCEALQLLDLRAIAARVKRTVLAERAGATPARAA